jgi:hypothetical protein
MDGFELKAYLEGLGVALEGPIDALQTLVETRRTLDRVESLLVEQARSNRSSWAEIGDALGVSRQAAYSRHRPLVKPTAGDSPRLHG